MLDIYNRPVSTKTLFILTNYVQYLFILSFLLSIAPVVDLNAQIIPESQKVDWSIVAAAPVTNQIQGSPFIPLGDDDQAYEYNMIDDFGADNKGKQDISEILQQALESTPPYSVLYFPPGVYLIKKTIFVPGNKVIRGRSPNTTLLRFDLEGRDEHLFSVTGRANSEYVKVTQPNKKGDFSVQVAEASLFKVGDNVEIEQENDPAIYTNPLWNQSWAQWAIGQLLRITHVKGKELHFDRTLTFDYNQRFKIHLQRIELTENVGFERFSIERTDGGRGSNFRFYYTTNSWIKCIHSMQATRTHVRLEKSSNCSVTGSYFDNAQYHCAGGAGYGVQCLDHTSECLIENNIFRRLRHSMMVKEGASRNVFSYNYSFGGVNSPGTIAEGGVCDDPLWEDPLPDISLHGHYPAMNLFEHNIVQHISIADYWGPSGPGNTFYRNKVEHSRSIEIKDFSSNQNLIANQVIAPIQIEKSVKNTLLYGNKVKGYGAALKIDTSVLPDSYYLLQKPYFYGNEPWPAIGPEYLPNRATIPAKERWERRKIFDKKCCGDVDGLGSFIHYYDDFILFFEQNNLFIEYTEDKLVDLMVINMQGNVVFQAERVQTNQPIPANYIFQDGLYIIQVFDYDKGIRNITKIIKM